MLTAAAATPFLRIGQRGGQPAVLRAGAVINAYRRFGSRGARLHAEEFHGWRGYPVKSSAVFTKSFTRQQGNRLIRLPAHAPGDVRFTRGSS